MNHYNLFQLISFLDLTSLNTDDTDEKIIQLCQQALSAPQTVAAVCIYPKFLKLARQQLKNNTIKLATVSNFPEGNHDLAATIAEIQQAINDGADEIDVVMPYQNYLTGQRDYVKEFIATCKQACGQSILLKVILETGALQQANLIAAASKDVIAAGADFIKTSTGKHAINATLAAAEIMLTTIRETNPAVGFKAAGGIRTIEQATSYIELTKKIMGENWLSPKTFRLGASSLMNEILQAIKHFSAANN